MKLRAPRLTPALAVVLLLASVVFFFGRTVDSEQADAYARDLRRLPALDARTSQAVLEARANVKADYDTLAGTLGELRRLHAVAAAAPGYLEARGRQRLIDEVRSSRDLLKQKEALVEEFKTENSVLRNSVAFAPVEARRVARLFDEQSRQALADDVRALVGELVVYHESPDAAARARIDRCRTTLTDDAQAAGVTPELATLLRHVDVILAHEPRAGEVSASILALPSLAAAEEIDATYSLEYGRTLQAVSRSRLGAFACAIAAVVLVGLDIIRRQRRSSDALRSTAQQLENAMETLRIEQAREREVIAMKSRFVALASHEFRTPLSIILSSSELLEAYGKTWDVDRQAPQFHRINAAVRGMVEMLDSILLVSKAEAGKLVAQKTEVDVDAFCSELVASLESSARGSHRIEYSIQGEWKGARFDPTHLRHALTNLLSNAIKYSPARSPVSLRVKIEGSEGVFVVQDSGIGIPQEDLGRLFQSFQRGSNVARIPGTGLGLAIVKHSVEASGGSISVSSELGKGTRFEVRLPVERGQA